MKRAIITLIYLLINKTLTSLPNRARKKPKRENMRNLGASSTIVLKGQFTGLGKPFDNVCLYIDQNALDVKAVVPSGNSMMLIDFKSDPLTTNPIPNTIFNFNGQDPKNLLKCADFGIGKIGVATDGKFLFEADTTTFTSQGIWQDKQALLFERVIGTANIMIAAQVHSTSSFVGFYLYNRNTQVSTDYYEDTRLASVSSFTVDNTNGKMYYVNEREQIYRVDHVTKAAEVFFTSTFSIFLVDVAVFSDGNELLSAGNSQFLRVDILKGTILETADSGHQIVAMEKIEGFYFVVEIGEDRVLNLRDYGSLRTVIDSVVTDVTPVFMDYLQNSGYLGIVGVDSKNPANGLSQFYEFAKICDQAEISCPGRTKSSDVVDKSDSASRTPTTTGLGDPTDTDPDTSNPNDSDPTNSSDPSDADPNSNDPSDADPNSTDPNSTDPNSTDPNSTDPNSTDPNSTDPNSTDPNDADPNSTDPNSTDPNDADPTPTDPNTTDPNPSNPDPDAELPFYPNLSDDEVALAKSSPKAIEISKKSETTFLIVFPPETVLSIEAVSHFLTVEIQDWVTLEDYTYTEFLPNEHTIKLIFQYNPESFQKELKIKVSYLSITPTLLFYNSSKTFQIEKIPPQITLSETAANISIATSNNINKYGDLFTGAFTSLNDLISAFNKIKLVSIFPVEFSVNLKQFISYFASWQKDDDFVSNYFSKQFSEEQFQAKLIYPKNQEFYYSTSYIYNFGTKLISRIIGYIPIICFIKGISLYPKKNKNRIILFLVSQFYRAGLSQIHLNYFSAVIMMNAFGQNTPSFDDIKENKLAQIFDFLVMMLDFSLAVFLQLCLWWEYYKVRNVSNAKLLKENWRSRLLVETAFLESYEDLTHTPLILVKNLVFMFETFIVFNFRQNILLCSVSVLLLYLAYLVVLILKKQMKNKLALYIAIFDFLIHGLLYVALVAYAYLKHVYYESASEEQYINKLALLDLSIQILIICFIAANMIVFPICRTIAYLMIKKMDKKTHIEVAKTKKEYSEQQANQIRISRSPTSKSKRRRMDDLHHKGKMTYKKKRQKNRNKKGKIDIDDIPEADSFGILFSKNKKGTKARKKVQLSIRSKLRSERAIKVQSTLLDRGLHYTGKR